MAPGLLGAALGPSWQERHGGAAAWPGQGRELGRE